MQRVTADQLVSILLAHPKKGAKQVTIVTRTRPKLLKKSRLTKEPCAFADGVERLAVRAVTLGASYEKAVNRQRANEHSLSVAMGVGERIAPGYFRAESLWGGAGVKDTAYTVEHAETGRKYFAVKPAQGEADNEAGSAAAVRESQWIDIRTGRVLDFEKDRLAEYLPALSKSEVQAVEHDVQWRTIALDSVVELRYGDVYQVIHEPNETRKAG